MKRKVHVVPHSHWDREWYFTTSRSKVYLMKDLKDVLDTLESNPDFKYFMVDAQGSLLDDYIKWMPQDKDRITKLVKEKKLVIGPWYTQTDQLVISGESIVRNMYYGMKRCETFGGYMNVGYVPDSFGQSGNMPQIYKEFGIDDTLFWRGVSDDMVNHTDYNWRGDDGSVVFTTQIPFGYYIGGNIPEDPKQSEEFWQKECFEKAGGRSATKHIYFPNGFDQAPIRTNLPEIIKERNEKDPENEYVISCIEDYIKDVKSENPELEEVSGELVIAKHMRIHKSIFSSRSDLKVMNTQIQNYVTNVMEPLLTLSYNLGNDYPHEAVGEIWKLLFENAAHDSIGSCISDTANEDVYVRYKQARDIAVNLVELHSRLIATSVKNDAEMTFTLINTLPQKRNDTVVVKTYIPGGDFAILDEKGNKVDYTVIESRDLTDYVLSQTIKLDPSRKFYVPSKVLEATIAIKTSDVPAFGYVQYTLDTKGNSAKNLEKKNTLENEFYAINVEEDGSLTITDKENNVTYKNQGVLVENGDDGDSFNTFQTIEKNAGRIEKRICRKARDIAWLAAHKWPGLRSVFAVERIVDVRGMLSKETSYYISSSDVSARELLGAVREHWKIESLHWLLDVTFSEDESRFLSENAHTTMNALRKFALTVHKNYLAALGKKRSLKANMLAALIRPENLLDLFAFL